LISYAEYQIQFSAEKLGSAALALLLFSIWEDLETRHPPNTLQVVEKTTLEDERNLRGRTHFIYHKINEERPL